MENANVLNQCFRLMNPPCIAEAVDGEMVIINLDSGNYYNLQNKSTQILEALVSGISPAQLIHSNQWGLKIQEAIEQFLAGAMKEGIIEATGTASNTAIEIPQISIGDPLTDISIAIYTDMQELLGLDPIHETHEVAGWPTKP